MDHHVSSEFHGQGIQHSGPGHFNARDIFIGPADRRDDEFLLKLRITDPRVDKTSLERQKGGLLADSYRWILSNDDFRRWRADEGSRLLWINGEPGKGKTMLVCGIIDELKTVTDCNVVYFFCQATDARLNTATAVLQGLMYLLLVQQPMLMGCLRERVGHIDEQLFQDVNVWDALCNMFVSLLKEPSLRITYLIVDGLDECTTDLDRLLRFFVNLRITRGGLLLSSRNWLNIRDGLSGATQKVSLSLEQNAEAVSAAVDTYIDFKVEELAVSKEYDADTRNAVGLHLKSNANNTFLWVALVCQELSNPDLQPWHTIAKLEEFLIEFPSGLDALYERMARQLFSTRDAELCRQALAVALVVYRPIGLRELLSLVESPEKFPHNPKWLRRIIELCASFLTLRDDVLHFVHQSAKDFLMNTNLLHKVLPQGTEFAHHMIATQSVQAMSKTLRWNIYQLPMPRAFSIDKATTPDHNPLELIQYPCLYWAHHLEIGTAKTHKQYLRDGEFIHKFLQEHLLHWLEALSLLKDLDAGIVATAKILSGVQASMKDEQVSREPELAKLAKDAWRFIRYHKTGIAAGPLQVYGSALVFSPERSTMRKLLQKEEAAWILTRPLMEDHWSACLQTLEGHSRDVLSVVFSPDGTRVASGSEDRAVRVWDAATGRCQWTLIHSEAIGKPSVAFSLDGKRLVSTSWDGTVRVWDMAMGGCIKMTKAPIEGRRNSSFHTVSPDGKWVAFGFRDGTVCVWDVVRDGALQTFEVDTDYYIDDSNVENCVDNNNRPEISSITFSLDGKRLASGSDDGKVRVWDMATGDRLETLRGDNGNAYGVRSVALSPNGTQVAATSENGAIWLWDIATGGHPQTLESDRYGLDSVAFSLNGVIYEARLVAFSLDGRRLASGSWNGVVHVWDTTTGQCQLSFNPHTINYNSVASLAFSPDGTRLASGCAATVQVWDVATGGYSQIPQDHRDSSVSIVHLVFFSLDGRRVVTGGVDGMARLWDAETGGCLHTLEHPPRCYSDELEWDHVRSAAFSPDGTRVAVGFSKRGVRVWDTETGTCLQVIMRRSGEVMSLTFSHDGALLASGTDTVQLWNTTTGKLLQTLPDIGHDSVTFSPDGTRIASASFHTVKLWDTMTGICLQKLKDPISGISHAQTSVAFSLDGKRVASASYYGKVRIWDATTSECLQLLEGESRPVVKRSSGYYFSSVGFSLDGKWVASSSHNGIVRIWNASTGECLRIFNAHGHRISWTLAGLQTNRGIFHPQAPSHHASQFIRIVALPQGSFSGIGISSDWTWILKNGEPHLWLPPEYRPSKVAVSGNTLALGSNMSRLFCFSLS